MNAVGREHMGGPSTRWHEETRLEGRQRYGGGGVGQAAEATIHKKNGGWRIKTAHLITQLELAAAPRLRWLTAAPRRQSPVAGGRKAARR